MSKLSLLSLAAVLAAPLAASAAPSTPSAELAAFPVAHHVTLHKLLDDHPSVNDCWGYRAPNGTELAIYGHQVGTAFVDATDPPNAIEVFNLPGPTSGWRDIKTYLNYAYIVTEGQGPGTGLQIVDLTDPLAPVHVNTYTGGGLQSAHNIWIETDAAVAYCCGAANGGMFILSLADPENPVQLDFFGNYYIHDLWVADGRGYAGAISSQTLRVLDLSNPANPITLATHPYPGAQTHNAWPNSTGQYCLTTDETTGGHIKIWNVQNLSNITLAAEWQVSTQNAIVHNVLVEDDLAYVSYYAAGARILDVTDPTDPVEVGYYDTSTRTGGFDGDWGVYPFRGDDVFYASDRQEGLFVLEFTGGYAGQVSGVVRNAATSQTIDDATVTFDALNAFETAANGSYAGRVTGATYSAVTSRYGFASDTSTVVVPEQGSVVHDVLLQPLPSGTVTVHVTSEASGAPLAGVVVDLVGTPVTGLVTDANGDVTIEGVPAGVPWIVRAARFGYALTTEAVVASAGGTVNQNVEMPRGFFDEFDADQAWTVGAPGDAATDGIWERAMPVGSSYLGPVEPDHDASEFGDGFAYLTEAHTPGSFAGTSDVDGGTTTLLSPVFDGTGLGSLALEYRRWFSNRAPTPDLDLFRADVSTDGGGSWTNLETIDVGTDTWAEVSIDLSAVVSPSATMRLRFAASDVNTDTFVEAGIDNVQLVTAATPAPELTGPVVSALSLAAPRPNPFATATTLSFTLPATGPVELRVYDVRGRAVATLLSASRLAAGAHHVTWDGRDGSGTFAMPGVYFAELRAGHDVVHRKLVRLR